MLKVDCSKNKNNSFSIKKRPVFSGKIATEEYFQSIYLNAKTKNIDDKIVFHRPLFESLTTGIICLKSLRLESCLGLVLQAPKSILKSFGEKILESDKDKSISKRPVGEIFEKLKNEALQSGIAIVYEQRPDLENTAAAIDLSEGNPRPWAPQKVHEKISEITPIINNKLKDLGIFCWPTVEYTDDVPILRILTGPMDPYSAERLGSFAFFSTQRGMEWYLKQFGKTEFEPHKHQVYVTYFCDLEKKETPECILSLTDKPEKWADALLKCMQLIKIKAAQSQLKEVLSAFKIVNIRHSEINVAHKENFTEILINAPEHKTLGLKQILGEKITQTKDGASVTKILNNN